MEENNLLLTPAAKKRCFAKREYPFPLVNSSCKEGDPDPTWKCSEGFLQDNCVLVHDEDSIVRLYNMGFFGKGTLSKSAPRVCTQKKKKQLTQDQKVETHDQPNKKSKDDDVIDVIDSDDENLKLKKENHEEVEVVLSDSSTEEGGKEKSEGNDSSKATETVEEESLQLTFEEAYFLSYGLGCLVVKEKDQCMNLTRLWFRLCELTPDGNFPVMYTAYHHFRSKGWIVRSGLKFGADYALYKDGPPFFHATYSVLVKAVKEQNLRDMRGNRHFTWASLAALNRINSTAGKGLIFLYVIRPHTMSENKISTPFCISQYRLEEVLFKRWVAAANREDDET